MPAADFEFQRLTSLRAIESGLLRLKWLAAATRFEIAMRRHDRALKYAYKYGYSPAQPRVPRGQPEGGQWAGDGTSSDSIRLAGDFPTGDSPEIPEECFPELPAQLERLEFRTQMARSYGFKPEVSTEVPGPKQTVPANPSNGI